MDTFSPTHITKEFDEAVETGRVERYMMDLGWEQMMQVFNLYGKAGGRKEDIAVTEALLGVIEGERVAEHKKTKQTIPTIICGDLYENPEKLQGIMRLIEEECWIDVGLHADWWGEPPAANTCEARPGLKESRIDGMIANQEAALLIQEVWVRQKSPSSPRMQR